MTRNRVVLFGLSWIDRSRISSPYTSAAISPARAAAPVSLEASSAAFVVMGAGLQPFPALAENLGVRIDLGDLVDRFVRQEIVFNPKQDLRAYFQLRVREDVQGVIYRTLN